MLFEVKNVCFAYPDGTTGLDGVSIGIEEGSQWAILGANGSGKSTLLRILNGLIEPAAGSVRFAGRALTEQTLQEPRFGFDFRQRVGFVFQDADAQLFNASVWDEVAFGPKQLGLTPKEVGIRVQNTLNFLRIEHLADRAPFRLSGGEKRKVAIASVLSMNPDVILLDEPILGLDARSQAWLFDTLQRLQRAGKTTVIATHFLPALENIAEWALVLGENHRVLACRSVTDVLDDIDLLLTANLAATLEAV